MCTDVHSFTSVLLKQHHCLWVCYSEPQLQNEPLCHNSQTTLLAGITLPKGCAAPLVPNYFPFPVLAQLFSDGNILDGCGNLIGKNNIWRLRVGQGGRQFSTFGVERHLPNFLSDSDPRALGLGLDNSNGSKGFSSKCIVFYESEPRYAIKRSRTLNIILPTGLSFWRWCEVTLFLLVESWERWRNAIIEAARQMPY